MWVKYEEETSVLSNSFIIPYRLRFICEGVTYKVIKSEEIIFKSLIFFVLLNLRNQL